MTGLTLKQKKNLFHLLVLFPIIYLAVNPEAVKSLDNKQMRRIVMYIILFATLYHIYLFAYVNNKEEKKVTFATPLVQ